MGTRQHLPLLQAVRDRTEPITVWGAGFIGLSAASAFTAAGFRCVVVDIDQTRVDQVNAGTVPLPGFEDRVDLDPIALREGRLRAAAPADVRALAARIHVVCVNTDRDGVPITAPLDSVLRQVRDARQPGGEQLISIESTLSPRWLSELIPAALGIDGTAPDGGLHLAAAPRRDWILSPDMNIRTLPRVVGAQHPESEPLLRELYSAVSDVVHHATDWRRAAMTKSVENLYRYVDLVLTNQLAEAYPDVDMVEVFRLAGTKWNVPVYHPSIGIGGYCIPLSPHFAGDGLVDRGLLPLVGTAIDWSAGYPDRMADRLMRECDGPIGILGLSYAANVKVTEGSPGRALTQALLKRGADVRVHDPRFSAEESEAFTGARSLSWPEDLSSLRTVVVVTPHLEYADLPQQLEKLTDLPTVVDNLGSFRDELRGTGVRYLEIGAPATAVNPN